MAKQNEPPSLQAVRSAAPVIKGCENAGCDFEFKCLEMVLSSLDALVYVADMQTYELLYVNQYGQKVWGLLDGRKCYEYLQAGQATPCSFCTNSRLLDEHGEPNGVLVWEFQNTVTQRWYQCRDQAIRWVDGRMVRLEIAVDITERKQFEQQLALAQKRAEDLARIDMLTGLHNRRAFFEYMGVQMSYLQRSPQPFSLVMFDIDHFKRVNDTFGHAMGDEVLVVIARTVQDCTRDSDQLFRIGGEEFLLTLPDCDEAGAFELVERVRRSIADIDFYAEAHAISLSCSFGITCHRAGVGVDGLLAEADQAMYVAKQEGRNRTRCYSQIAAA